MSFQMSYDLDYSRLSKTTNHPLVGTPTSVPIANGSFQECASHPFTWSCRDMVCSRYGQCVLHSPHYRRIRFENSRKSPSLSYRQASKSKNRIRQGYQV